MQKFSWHNFAELVGTFAIVAGLILVAYELRQNSQLMRAQVFNDRTSQGIEVFLTVAENRELGEIDNKLAEAGFPGNPAALAQLSPVERRQYAWLLRADRFRLENVLYQQVIGVMDYDEGHIEGAYSLLEKYDALGQDGTVVYFRDPTIRLRRLLAELEEIYRQE